MLTEEEKDRIIRSMCVYEHEWRYLASYLGEPFLLEDILVFFDGRALNVCVFTLGDARQLSCDDLERRMATLDQGMAPELVHVWGNVHTPEGIEIGGKEPRCVMKAKEEYLGEYSIDISEQSESFSAEARKAIRSFERDGLRVTINPSTRLSWRELDLIEKWQDRISPGIAGTVAGASISNYVLSERSLDLPLFSRETFYSALAMMASNVTGDLYPSDECRRRGL